MTTTGDRHWTVVATIGLPTQMKEPTPWTMSPKCVPSHSAMSAFPVRPGRDHRIHRHGLQASGRPLCRDRSATLSRRTTCALNLAVSSSPWGPGNQFCTHEMYVRDRRNRRTAAVRGTSDRRSTPPTTESARCAPVPLRMPRAPGVPVDRILAVPAQVRRGLVGKSVHSFDRIPTALVNNSGSLPSFS